MKTLYTNDNQSSYGHISSNTLLSFLVFVLLIALSLPGKAYHPAGSELNIHLHDNAVFNISVNNVEYNNFTSQYTIKNLPPGRHLVTITRYKVSSNGYSRTYQFPQVVFSGYIRIKPNTQEFAYIDHRGRYIVEQSMTMRTQPTKRLIEPVRYQQPMAMSPYTFEMLKNTLAATSFDSSRLKIAQQAIADNNVTSEQVYQLMMMLSFESNRLKLAQFAYPYTIDKGNYFLVHNAFNFNSSSNRLNSYIAQLR